MTRGQSEGDGVQAGQPGLGQQNETYKPVTEVGLSVAMTRQSTFTGPTFPRVLQDWLLSHPRVETMPPYVMPPESPDIPLQTQSASQFNIITSGMEPRYWLHSGDETEVVQVQSDYLGLNWRRGDPGGSYIGYQSIKGRFLDLLEVVATGLREIGGSLEPIRAELAYVNIISPNRVWSKLSDMSRVIAVSLPHVEDYEHFSFAYSKNISYDGRLHGRLHVAVQPGYDWVKDEPRIGLNIVARSLELGNRSIDGAMAFIDHAHDEAGIAFHKLLTPAAKEMWGFTDDID